MPPKTSPKERGNGNIDHAAVWGLLLKVNTLKGVEWVGFYQWVVDCMTIREHGENKGEGGEIYINCQSKPNLEQVGGMIRPNPWAAALEP